MKRAVTTQVQSEKLVADRHERIIRAAIVVFHRQGFHTTTTADIAREAGLTQSNLYNYIRSKQDILFMVCKHLVGTYESIIDEVCKQHQDPSTRIVEAVRAVIEVMSLYRDEVQLLYNETHALEKSDRAVILSQISHFIDRFEVLIKDYIRDIGPLKIKSTRIGANCLSFIPAIVALRNWDLERHNRYGANQEIIEFILRGLGIRPRDADNGGVADGGDPS